MEQISWDDLIEAILKISCKEKHKRVNFSFLNLAKEISKVEDFDASVDSIGFSLRAKVYNMAQLKDPIAILFIKAVKEKWDLNELCLPLQHVCNIIDKNTK